MNPPNERAQLVKMARQLERHLAKRRKLVKQLTDLDREIRDARKFVRDLTEPDPTEVYRPDDGEAGSAMTRIELDHRVHEPLKHVRVVGHREHDGLVGH